MRSVNVNDAKTHFSSLIDEVVAGEQVTITEAGKPVARLIRIGAAGAPRRTGFLQGLERIPDDFDRLCSREIATFFGTQAWLCSSATSYAQALLNCVDFDAIPVTPHEITIVDQRLTTLDADPKPDKF